MTQVELGNVLGVSDKTISKWERGKGLPDICMIEPLAKALNVSVIELMSGECIMNQNKAANMLKSNFFVCPICGNVIHTIGESVVSCCGIQLPILEANETSEYHDIHMERIENEIYITVHHEMTKEHYISFIAYLTKNKLEMVKLYPEQNAEARFMINGCGKIYIYCNQDGLYIKDFK